nr:flagellar hook-associated protein FlgK [uncultured Clostridium sp.]
MASIFSTFNTAKSGLTVHQSGINVTSHNIANSSTVGYSRQRAKIQTSRPITLGAEAGQVGTGAQISAIERVRDSFLDYQVRVETAELGKYSTKLDYLSQVEGIFNEPSDTGISTALSDFFDAFQELSKQSTSSSTRVVVTQKTKTLCDLINNTYTKLEKLQENSVESVKNSVKEVNSILEQLTIVNNQIRIASITGDQPNDLMDSRDNLLDELSSKFGIDVDKTQFNGNDITATGIGANLNPLVNSEPNGEVTRLSFISEIKDNGNGSHTISYFVNGDTEKPKTITVSGLAVTEVDTLKKTRILLTDGNGEMLDGKGNIVKDGGTIANPIEKFIPKSGEIAGAIEVQESIGSYMNQLDKMAKGLALSVNAIHSGSMHSNIKDTTKTLDFFVASDGKDEAGINAKNISINTLILENPSFINTKENVDAGEGDGSRALAIAQLQSTLISISKIDSTTTRAQLCKFTNGSTMSLVNDVASGTKVESYFQDVVDKLGVEAQHAKRVVSNEEDLLNSLDISRLSVSGVSLDEEMTNLIQYQKAYSANAKTITTVSDMLDIILGLI